MNSNMENYVVVDGYLQEGYRMTQKNGQFRFEGRIVTIGNRGGRHSIQFRVSGDEAHKAFMLAKAGQKVRMSGYLRTSHYGLIVASFTWEAETKQQTPQDMLTKAAALFAAEHGPQQAMIVRTEIVDRGQVDAGPFGEVDPDEDDDDPFGPVYLDEEEPDQIRDDPYKEEKHEAMIEGLVEEIDNASIAGHEAERGLSPVDPEDYR